MSLTSPGSVPPGWYPDPSGQRRWRVWTGTIWSEVTREYGERVTTKPLVDALALIRALDRLIRYGIVAVFAGLGLLMSVLAHWPGTAQPINSALAMTLSDAGVTLLLIGSVCYAFAVRELEGRWTVLALTPVLNVVAVSGLVSQRITGRRPTRRIISETVLLGLFVTLSHVHPWLGIAPVLIATDHLRWTSVLIDSLSGSAKSPSDAS